MDTSFIHRIVCYSLVDSILCSQFDDDDDDMSGDGETTATDGAKTLKVDTGGTSKTTTTTSPRPSPVSATSRRGSINSHIEEKIGCCLEEFRCQHNNFTGILYVGPLGIVFLGRFLLFEWTVVLKWEDVTKVRRKASTPTAFDNSGVVAIRIETSVNNNDNALPNEGVYDFEGFFDSEKALESLIGLHNDSMLDETDANKIMISKRGSVIPLRRSNSDPAKQISNIFSFDDEDKILRPSPNNQNPNQTTILDLRDQYSARNKDALLKIAAAADGSSQDDPEKEKPAASEEELQTEWDTLKAQLDKYPAAPIRDKELALEGGLESFVEKFVNDDAPHSWAKFMEDIIGDSEVKTETWKVDNNSDSVAKTCTRTIEYTHPVNAPMAPPMARARKEQTLKKYGFGLLVETKTVVSDVPMTDCFYVRDVLQLKRGKNNNKWLLNIRFEVVFVKSTMFRGLINKTTTGEFDKFMKNLAGWLSDHSGSSGVFDPSTEEEAQNEAIDKAQPIQVVEKAQSTPNSSGFGLLVAVVFLLWMAQMQYQLATDNKYLKDDLRELKSMLFELQTQRLAEERLLRNEWKEYKSTLVGLEQTRILEQKAFRSDLSEWRSSFQEHETSRATEAQSFWDELLEWKSALLDSSSKPECQQESEPAEEDFHQKASATSIPRAGGMGGPLKVEPVQDRSRFPNSGQKAPSIEEMNDWEKLEKCTDCY